MSSKYWQACVLVFAQLSPLRLTTAGEVLRGILWGVNQRQVLFCYLRWLWAAQRASIVIISARRKGVTRPEVRKGNTRHLRTPQAAQSQGAPWGITTRRRERLRQTNQAIPQTCSRSRQECSGRSCPGRSSWSFFLAFSPGTTPSRASLSMRQVSENLKN